MRKIKDRREAGRLLAGKLQAYAGEEDVMVLGLPRGGVPVAFEVAQSLRAPLDVFLVRKLGVPGHEELAMGAVSNGGARVLNHDVIAQYGISADLIERVAAHAMAEIRRRDQLYRKGFGRRDIAGQTVLLVDDGLATGSTMLAALKALRIEQPERIVVAVPVAPPSTCELLREEVDDLVCLMTPQPFFSVGTWYDDFAQTTDEEVAELLRIAQSREEEADREGDVRHETEPDLYP